MRSMIKMECYPHSVIADMISIAYGFKKNKMVVNINQYIHTFILNGNVCLEQLYPCVVGNAVKCVL